MSEEEKKDEHIGSSDDEEIKEDDEIFNTDDEKKLPHTESSDDLQNAPFGGEPSNSTISNPKKLYTAKVKIPHESVKRLHDKIPGKSTEERWVYMLKDLNCFFREKRVHIDVEKLSPESLDPPAEKKLKISYEDSRPTEETHELASHLRELASRLSVPQLISDSPEESSTDTSSKTSPDEENLPASVGTEPLPSFTSTFISPLRNLNVPPISPIEPIQAKHVLETEVAAEVSVFKPTDDSSTLEFYEPVQKESICDLSNDSSIDSLDSEIIQITKGKNKESADSTVGVASSTQVKETMQTRNIHSLPPPTSPIAQIQSVSTQTREAETKHSVYPATVSSLQSEEISANAQNAQGNETANNPQQNISRIDTGSEIAERVVPIFHFLLQDLLELQSFLRGRAIRPDEPSTSSGHSISLRDLAAISEYFGTGVESDAAVATRDLLQDVDKGLDVALVIQTLRHIKHPDEIPPPPPPSPKPKRSSLLGKRSHSGNPKKAIPSGKTRHTFSKEEPAKLDPDIESRDVEDVATQLRGFNDQAEYYLRNGINIIEIVLNYCRMRPAEGLRERVESLVGEVIRTLESLAALREECSSLLTRCTNRNDFAGVVYILKVKTQIATGYNAILQQLLTYLSNFWHQS